MKPKTCVVVGFGPGVGQGVAHAFGAAGFRLGLIARTPAKQADALERLRAAGMTAELYAADAGDASALESAVARAGTELGAIDALVYNAAAASPGTPSVLSPEQLAADLRTNVVGALAAARAVLPAMRARKSGTVLFTGGGFALHPAAEYASLSVGKAAVRALALALAEELAGTGVRAGTVTIMGMVEPGGRFDPDRIGEAFVALHDRPADRFEPELLFHGV